MLYKEITCPKCNGYGFTAHYDDNSAWSEWCEECNGRGTLVVPMTNGDVIRRCNNERLVKIYSNLEKYAIYAGGNNDHLVNWNDVEDLALWLNKETDKIDLETIFDFIDEKDYEHLYLQTISI